MLQKKKNTLIKVAERKYESHFITNVRKQSSIHTSLKHSVKIPALSITESFPEILFFLIEIFQYIKGVYK